MNQIDTITRKSLITDIKMFTAALIATAFTLLVGGAYGFYMEPFPSRPKLETDCSGPPAENKVEIIPDVSYPFRNDYLALNECKAYENVPCSPTTFDYCHVELYGRADRARISPFYKTYFELNCADGWRSSVQTYTNKFSIISPKRALTMKLGERSDMNDPVHSDVFEPVRSQVIDITIQARASTTVTSKIYHIGILPSLVALHIESGKNLSIKRYDFNRIPNVRYIVFYKSTIMEMEPYTFTDLPHLSSLSVDKGLSIVFHDIDMHLKGLEGTFYEGRWYDADLDKIYRLHCNCQFAWYRNFLQSKPELMESKQPGAMAVIGSYMSDFFTPFGYDSDIASVDCARNSTKDNYMAGVQFSYNTSCFSSC